MTCPWIAQGGGIWIGAGTVTIQSTNIYNNTADSVRLHSAPSQNIPPATLEEVSMTCPWIAQGGGIFIGAGTVTIQNTNIYRNTANGVRLLLELSWNLPPVTPWKTFL